MTSWSVFNRFDRNTKLRLNKFDFASRASIDVIRFDPFSELRHRKEVIRLAQQALERGEHFITRARLDPQMCGEVLVADFYNIDWNTVIEVADSEDTESIQKKSQLWQSLGFHFQALFLKPIKGKQTVVSEREEASSVTPADTTGSRLPSEAGPPVGSSS